MKKICNFVKNNYFVAHNNIMLISRKKSQTPQTKLTGKVTVDWHFLYSAQRKINKTIPENLIILPINLQYDRKYHFTQTHRGLVACYNTKTNVSFLIEFYNYKRTTSGPCTNSKDITVHKFNEEIIVASVEYDHDNISNSKLTLDIPALETKVISHYHFTCDGFGEPLAHSENVDHSYLVDMGALEKMEDSVSFIEKHVVYPALRTRVKNREQTNLEELLQHFSSFPANIKCDWNIRNKSARK